LFSSPRSGIHYALWAAFFYAGMNAIVKFIPHIPVPQIVFFRSLIMFCLTLFFLKRQSIPPLGTKHLMLVLRGIFGTSALVLHFSTVQVLPLATASVLHNLSPIFSTLIAFLLLSERLTANQWICIFISFLGVVVMKGIDFDWNEQALYYSTGIGSAIVAAMAYNVIRAINTQEHSLVILFYLPLVAIPTTGIWMMFVWVDLTWLDCLIILMIGVSTQAAQYCTTKSYQSEAVNKVAIVSYLNVVYSILLGLIIFGEMLSSYNWIGMLLVIGGVLTSLYMTKYQREKVSQSTQDLVDEHRRDTK
jgi:drug/metabolite transporter (DMT)-like permease